MVVPIVRSIGLRPLLRSLAVGLLAASAALFAVAAAGPAAAGGGAALAPEIVVTDGLNGVSSTTKLAALRGKPVLLAFWIPICPHCQTAAASLDRLKRTYGPKGLQVVAVSHGKKRYVDYWLKQRGLSFGVGFDWTGYTAARYGVRMLPGLFLIGKDGTIRASGLNGMDAAVQAELARK